jgi:hypothetical protein
MTLKGHDIIFKMTRHGKIELYLDGEFEGVFDSEMSALNYVIEEVPERA